MKLEDNDEVKRLLEGGYVDAAQHALEDILRADPRDLPAWSLYIKSWKTFDKRIQALELCLKYNPGNADVQRALDNVRSRAKSAALPSAPAPRPVTPPPSQPKTPVYEEQAPAWLNESGTGNTSTVENLSAPSPDDRPVRMSKEEIDRQAREYVEERSKKSREIGRPLAWYEVWYTALTQANVDAYDSLRLNPYALPSRTYIWLLSVGMVSGLVGALSLGFNPQFFQALTMLEQQMGVSGVTQVFSASLFCFVPLTGVMNLINTAISVGIMHLIAKMFGGKGKYSEFLYLVAAFSAPMSMGTTILGFIPFVNLCLVPLLGLWSLNLNVQAVKSAHSLDTFRALGVILTPILLVTIFGCVLWLLFYSTIAALVPGGIPTPTY
jgi:hypothetical protein